VAITGIVSVTDALNLYTTTQAAGTAGIVWLAPTQTITATVTGTVSLSPASATTQAAQTGFVTWLAPTQTITATVTGSVGISSPVTTTQAAVTGVVVWMAPTQTVTATVTGSVSALAVGFTAVQIVVTSSAVPAGGTTVVFTIFPGPTVAPTSTTSYVIPAGKTLRILAMQVQISVSITTTPVTCRMAVLCSTALPSYTPTVPVPAIVLVSAANTTVGAIANQMLGLAQDIPAGATIAMGISMSAATGELVVGIVTGYLFP
jgi:hypothetical protein